MLFTQKSCCWKRSLFLHKKESNDTNMWVSNSSFLNILKRMIQSPEGFYARGPYRELIFLQNLRISNKNTMFSWRVQKSLQQCDLYGSLTFLTFVSENLLEYILFFCKMWIIPYVEKVKTVWLFSVFSPFGYYFLLSSHLFFTHL